MLTDTPAVVHPRRRHFLWDIIAGECNMKISEKPMHKFSWYLRLLFCNQERGYGQVLKSSPLCASAQALFGGGSSIRRAGHDNPADPALRSLVMVSV